MTTESTNTDGSAKPGAEGSTQDQSELTRAIAEYEKADGSQSIVKALKTLEPVVDYVKDERQSKAKTRFDSIIKEATDHLLAGDDLEAFKKTAKNPERVARGYLEALAREDTEFEKVANQYFDGDNQKGWQAKLDAAKTAFSEEFGALKEIKVKDDAEAARLAVAGQTTEKPPEEGPSVSKMFAMSDQEWDTFKADELQKAQS